MAKVNENIMNHPHQLSVRVSGSHDNADEGVGDVIVAAGPGGGPHVKVLDGGDVSAQGSAFNGRFLTADDLTRETGRAAGGVNERESGLVYSGESGGTAGSATDDVIVDGRIITAEDWPQAASGTTQFPWQVSLRSHGHTAHDDAGGTTRGTPPSPHDIPYVVSFQDSSDAIGHPTTALAWARVDGTTSGINDYVLITDFPPAHALAGDLVFG